MLYLIIYVGQHHFLPHGASIWPPYSPKQQAHSWREFPTRYFCTVRPKGSPTLRELTDYLYFKRNVAGVQREWWCHRHGCQAWFTAERDTRTNTVLSVEVPAEQ